MCYSCYMSLFTSSPKMKSRQIIRKSKERLVMDKDQKIVSSFLNKNQENYIESSSLNDSFRFQIEKEKSPPKRVEESPDIFTNIMKKSNVESSQKFRKDQLFYIKASSKSQRHPINFTSSTGLDRSASRSIGNLISTTERNESAEKYNSKNLAKYARIKEDSDTQGSPGKDENSSNSDSKSFLRVRKIVLNPQMKSQNGSEIEDSNEIDRSSIQAKLLKSKSQSLMNQLKQFSGGHSYPKVIEKSVEESKSSYGDPTDSKMLINHQRRGSIKKEAIREGRSESGLDSRQERKIRNSSVEVMIKKKEELEDNRQQTEQGSRSKMVCTEEASDLLNHKIISELISGSEKKPCQEEQNAKESKEEIGRQKDNDSARIIQKDQNLALCRVRSLSSLNAREFQNQSLANRKGLQLQKKPSIEDHKRQSADGDSSNKGFIESYTDDGGKSSKLESNSPSEIRIEDLCDRSGEKVRAKSEDKKEQITTCTFNICNEINRGIDFIKSKAFTKSTSWLGNRDVKQGIPPRDRSRGLHRSSLSSIPVNPNVIGKDQTEMIKTANLFKQNTNSPQQSLTNFEKQKQIDPFGDIFLQSPPESVINWLKDSEAEEKKGQQQERKTRLNNEKSEIEKCLPMNKLQPFQAQDVQKDFILSPNGEGFLSERFEVCLLNKDRFDTFEMSESDDEKDKDCIKGDRKEGRNKKESKEDNAMKVQDDLDGRVNPTNLNNNIPVEGLDNNFFVDTKVMNVPSPDLRGKNSLVNPLHSVTKFSHINLINPRQLNNETPSRKTTVGTENTMSLPINKTNDSSPATMRESYMKKRKVYILKKSDISARTFMRDTSREKKVSFKDSVDDSERTEEPIKPKEHRQVRIRVKHPSQERLSRGASEESVEGRSFIPNSSKPIETSEVVSAYQDCNVFEEEEPAYQRTLQNFFKSGHTQEKFDKEDVSINKIKKAEKESIESRLRENMPENVNPIFQILKYAENNNIHQMEPATNLKSPARKKKRTESQTIQQEENDTQEVFSSIDKRKLANKLEIPKQRSSSLNETGERRKPNIVSKDGITRIKVKNHEDLGLFFKKVSPIDDRNDKSTRTTRVIKHPIRKDSIDGTNIEKEKNSIK